jgi:hypothetical protein
MKLIIEANTLPDNFTGIAEDNNGDKFWFRNGKYHREDGPAIEYSNGDKEWYLNNKQYSESEFLSLTKSPSCNGKVVEIDGKKYKLTLV